MSPFRYGASFVDQATGLRFEAHHPASNPDRWEAYLAGAAREYHRYGIDDLVDRRSLERGDGVSLFFVGVDKDDRVVAGTRFYGPLDESVAAQTLREMARSPEWEQHRDTIASATPYGVVEAKGAWRQLSGDGNHLVLGVILRCCVHAVEWLGAEILLAAAADRLEGPLAAAGSIMMGRETAPYPDERYRTILTGIRRARYQDVIDDAQAKLLRSDTEQLLATSEDAVHEGWRPIVLDQRHRADRQILTNLRSDPAITMIDMLDRQREELRTLLPPPDAALVEEAPRHVYYPWRRTVVRLLGPEAFHTVRLDRNRNRITREEQDRLRRQRIGIVGLSSGHAVATTIAIEGLCRELRLADFDDMELSNLNRIPASVLDIGVHKAVLAARRAAEIDPYLEVKVARQGFTSENAEAFVSGLDVVVEQCDEIAMKVLVREVARRHSVAVVMETSDRGLLDVERFDVEPERPIFHGLLDDVTSSAMSSMSTSEKVPHVLAIVDASRISARTAASMAEIGRTLSTWPQLGSDVTLGGAAVATVVRRIGLGEAAPSGRTRVDLDEAVSSVEVPTGSAFAPSTREHARLPIDAGTAQDASALPATRSVSRPPDPLLGIVHAAALAPSCGNGQPWRFDLTNGELAIEIDRAKGCGAMDVRGRASYVGIGAALFNARVAAAAASRLGAVRLFPEGPSSNVVASLELGNGSDESLAELYEPMLDRCSNRRHGKPAALDLAIGGRLSRAAAEEGATLHLATDPARIAQCADILGATERTRFLTPALLQETVHELRWPGEDIRSGLDVATLEFSGTELATLDLMRRADVMELLERWDGGAALGDYLVDAIHSSSAVAVLTVDDATSPSYVTGGMALERVWIEAQRWGLGVQAIGPSFLYAVQDTDYESLGGARWAGALRDLTRRFRALFGLRERTAYVLVLRLSHAPPPTARSVRLPIHAMLRRRGAVPAG